MRFDPMDGMTEGRKGATDTGIGGIFEGHLG